jgi:hypothetical protein|tara:strand:- start:426 stop:896 length:471 start_codon:yes stop_codon:yes gene_type:complete
MSTVVLDTITGKSTATTITIGSTPVVSASANSMTIRGEGSAQTSIQQGLAKAWVHYEMVSTFSTYDSNNVSSLTDVNAGVSRVTFNNNMNNANYGVLGCAEGSYGNPDGNQGRCAFSTPNKDGTYSTSQVDMNHKDSNDLIYDPDHVMNMIHGDLA